MPDIAPSPKKSGSCSSSARIPTYRLLQFKREDTDLPRRSLIIALWLDVPLLTWLELVATMFSQSQLSSVGDRFVAVKPGI